MLQRAPYGGTMVGLVAYPKANNKLCKDFDISYLSKSGAFTNFLLINMECEKSARFAAYLGCCSSI
jgi:hypothetical protein